MAAIPVKKLLQFLAPDQPYDLRLAVVRVLRALGINEAAAGDALLPLLNEAASPLKAEAVQLLGVMRHRPALQPLLGLIEHGGEAGEAAAYAVAHLGERGITALHSLMPKVAPGIRRYIGAALAAVPSSPAERLGVLQDKDPGVVEAAVRSIHEQLPTLKPKERQHLFEQLVKLANRTRPPVALATELAALRLLAALDNPKAAKTLWPRLDPKTHAEVRIQALQTLGNWANQATPAQWTQLFRSAEDQDFRIASLALVILRKLPPARQTQKHWLKLLQAPDVSVRRLALEKLADADTKEVAVALAEQLAHPDQSLREEALARLVRLNTGRKLISARLLGEASVDRAWTLARALSRHLALFPAAWRADLFKRAAAYLEKEDRMADPLLFLLREGDPKKLKDWLAERGLHWRKKKDYAKALHYLKLLARDPAFGFAQRFELAACGLKVSPKELSPEGRQADPCLHQFALLCQQDEAALLKLIDRHKWVEPDDLYYLGFHFSEQERPFWRFASELLERVVRRAPKSKTALAAKSKLKRAALA
jgi:hypothetical protein